MHRVPVERAASQRELDVVHRVPIERRAFHDQYTRIGQIFGIFCLFR